MKVKYVINKFSSIIPPLKRKILAENKYFYEVEGDIIPSFKIAKNICEVIEEEE